MSILSFLFGNKDKRVLRKLGSVVNSINDLEQNFDSFTNEELKNTLIVLDWDYLKNKINRWKEGEDFDAIFIICLISLSKFLQITK